MSLNYSTGEPVLKGDHIRYHGEVGEVEFLAEGGDPETSDLVAQFGVGYMITAVGFGSVFVDHPSDDVDLEFVSRAAACWSNP
jgi:hypothetical protein